MTMNKTSVRFAPWVGSHYARGLDGLRVLLVCESHYGDKKHERPTATPEIVKALALGQTHPLATRKLGRHPHFAKIMSAVQNTRRRFSSAEKRDFWNSVAYYNFLQEFIRDTRVHPTQDAWERGASAFSEVLDALAPELIVCLSARNGKRIRALAKTVPVAVVNHPSSHFAYCRVNPVIADGKRIAMIRKPQTPKLITSDVLLRWQAATHLAVPTPGPHLAEPAKHELAVQRAAAMTALDESF